MNDWLVIAWVPVYEDGCEVGHDGEEVAAFSTAREARMLADKNERDQRENNDWMRENDPTCDVSQVSWEVVAREHWSD